MQAWAVVALLHAAAIGQPAEAFRFADPAIIESSGLAASVVHPGVVWTHNDSGNPARLFAVDQAGATVATLDVEGALNVDWEAVAMGRGPDGSAALFVADTGANLSLRPQPSVYVVAEPSELASGSVPAERFPVSYADGRLPDVETILVDPVTNQVFLVEKRDGGGVVYAGPERLVADQPNVFTPIGTGPTLVSDGTFLADGRVALRNNTRVRLYDRPGGVEQAIMELPRMSVGESVTAAVDGTALLLGSEGAGSAVWRLPLGNRAAPPSAAPSTPTPMPTQATTTATEPAQGAPAEPEPRATRSYVWPVAAGAAAVGLLAAALARLRRHGRHRTG